MRRVSCDANYFLTFIMMTKLNYCTISWIILNDEIEVEQRICRLNEYELTCGEYLIVGINDLMRCDAMQCIVRYHTSVSKQLLIRNTVNDDES